LLIFPSDTAFAPFDRDLARKLQSLPFFPDGKRVSFSFAAQHDNAAVGCFFSMAFFFVAYTDLPADLFFFSFCYF